MYLPRMKPKVKLFYFLMVKPNLPLWQIYLMR